MTDAARKLKQNAKAQKWRDANRQHYRDYKRTWARARRKAERERLATP